MAYADGPSGSEDANDWLGNLFKPVGKWFNDKAAANNKNIANTWGNPDFYAGNVGRGGSADIKQAPVGDFSGGSTGSFDPTSMVPTSNQQPQQSDPMLDMLRDAINNPNPYSSGPYMANLDAARSASLKNIADTRDSTNKNFEASNAAVGGIYAKGKQDTLADNSILKDNNANLVGGLNGMYSNAISTLQGDRTKEMSDKADMMNRLGIQAGGLGTAGDTQTQAIANASQNQQAAADKALQYGGADLTANTARADGLISEGAGRQAQLRSQLSGILGQLSNKELDINNQYAQNSMQAANQGYQDNLSRMSALYGMKDKQQTYDQNNRKIDANSRVMVQAMKGPGGSAGGQTNMQDANDYVASQGGNPSDYNNAYTGAVMDTGTPAGMQPTEHDLLQAMMAKNKGLDLNQALAYIRNASNASKYNSPTQNSGNMALAQQFMNY